MHHVSITRLSALMAALALGAHVQTLPGAVLISDDFEDAANVAGGSPANWTVTNGEFGNVWHRIDPVAQSPFSGGGDSKGIRASDDRNTATSTLQRGLGAAQTNALDISFDFSFTGLRVAATNNNNEYVFQLRDSLGAVGLQLFLSDAVDDVTRTATVASLTPQGTRQALGTIAQDGWYRVRITTDPTGAAASDLTYDVTIDQYVSGSEAGGDLVTAPIGSQADISMFADVDDFADIQFTAANNAAETANIYLGGKHLDNVQVSTVVPEPAALSVAFGALALLGRRRRVMR